MSTGEKTGATVARPSGCRIETRLDAWRSGKSVETSLDAADTSVRATMIIAALLFCALARAADPTVSLQEVASRKPPDFSPLYEGRSVIVSGQVSARAIHVLNFVHLGIQERQHGLILETTGTMFDRLSPGDWVEARGRVVGRWGLPVVAVSKIAVVSTGAPPLQVFLKPADVQKLDRVGQLVVTEGPVIEVGSNFGGAYMRVGATPTALKVFLPSPNHGFVGFAVGELVRVTGLAYQYCPNPPYNDQFELLIGNVKDVARVNRSLLQQMVALWPGLALLAGMGFLWWRRETNSRKQREMLRTIYKLGEEILSASSSVEIVNKVAQVLPKVLHVTAAKLYIYDRGTQTLNPAGEPLDSGISIDSPAGLVQTGAVTCFQNHTLLSIPDTRRHPFPPTENGQSGSRLPCSILFVPMLAQGEPVGVFQVDNGREARNFSPDERAVAQHLANQMGLAIKLLQQRSFREQLSRSEKLAAVGRLISGVVNDLQTPLEAISSMASSALEQHTGSPPGHELLVIASEARRASTIVTRLVSFVQPESAQSEPVDLNILLRNLIQFREHEWKACGIQLRNLTKEKPLYVMGSHGQLEQVFLNLFVHAEQALEGAPEKWLKVRADLMASRVFIEIGYSAGLLGATADGLPPQGNSGEAEAGTLGLDVCRSIVAGHSGELRVSSSGEQSLFEIEIPWISPDQLAVQAAPPEAAQSRRWTALLLEPEEFVERRLVEWLSNRGYRVVPVRSSEVGLDLVQRMRFDVVLCSTHLTGLNWVEFFDRVRGRVGAFTLLAEAFSQDLSIHFRGEGRYVLQKPIEQSQFDRTLADVEGRLLSVEARAPEVESY